MPKVNSKKKRFHGQNRRNAHSNITCSDEGQSSNTTARANVSTPRTETASARKRSDVAGDNHDVMGNSFGYRLVELSSLLSAFQPLQQSEAGGELALKDDEARRYGNSSVIEIECSKCDTKLELKTSGHTGVTWTPQSSMDVKKRMVYAASEMGVGREGMSAMCDILNMPPPCNRSSWNNHVNALYEAHKKTLNKHLQKAKEKVSSLHEPNESNVVEIPVNYDGT